MAVVLYHTQVLGRKYDVPEHITFLDFTRFLEPVVHQTYFSISSPDLLRLPYSYQAGSEEYQRQQTNDNSNDYRDLFLMLLTQQHGIDNAQLRTGRIDNPNIIMAFQLAFQYGLVISQCTFEILIVKKHHRQFVEGKMLTGRSQNTFNSALGKPIFSFLSHAGGLKCLCQAIACVSLQAGFRSLGKILQNGYSFSSVAVFIHLDRRSADCFKRIAKGRGNILATHLITLFYAVVSNILRERFINGLRSIE